MIGETITVSAASGMFGGWKAVAVTAALNEAARSFDIEVTETGGIFGDVFALWPFPPGTPVSVLASGSLLVTGYVDTYAPSGDANAHQVRISGRAKGQDYADCSCQHPTGRFDNKKIEEIAAELDVYGVGVSAEVDTGKPVEWFHIRQGETPHGEMLRLARQRKLTLKGRADGSIVFTKGGVNRHAGGLVQGQNIEKMSATLSSAERFSDYKAIGQSSHGTTDKHLKPKGEARDGGVSRYRNRIIVDQADTTEEKLKARAQWEAKRAAGFSVKAQITTPSFRDAAGQLWEPGWTVFVAAPWLKIEQDMLVESVTFSQDGQAGTQAALSLVDPRAYDGEATGGSSGEMWRMP